MADAVVSDHIAPGAALSERIWRQQGATAVIANSAGGLFVFVFLSFLYPYASSGDGDIVTLSGLLGAGYLALSLPLGALWNARRAAPIDDWLRSGRPAGDDERARALRRPLEFAASFAFFWALAALLFGLLNASVDSAAVGLNVFVTTVLGGLTTSALGYLVAERIYRPVLALALTGGSPTKPVTPGVTARLTMAWALATGVPVLGIAAVALAQLSGSEASPDTAAGASLVLAATALSVGLLATVMAARSVADPLGAVRSALRRVEQGEFGARVPVDDGSEIGLLEAGFNRMAAGLDERERLRDLFGRHVGQEVARSALDREVALGGEEREIAALFVDVIGSTGLALRRPPGDVVKLLNRFFRNVVEVTEAHGGLVNKFEGDAALCVFGAPVARSNPAADGLAAARSLHSRLRRELSDVDVGIGVSAGTAVAGNIGAEQRFEYTVIGDPVNEAARLCELAKLRADRLLASGRALARAGDAEARHWRLRESVTLRGMRSETRLAVVADDGGDPACAGDCRLRGGRQPLRRPGSGDGE